MERILKARKPFAPRPRSRSNYLLRMSDLLGNIRLSTTADTSDSLVDIHPRSSSVPALTRVFDPNNSTQLSSSYSPLFLAG